jgi:hypothetical protein
MIPLITTNFLKNHLADIAVILMYVVNLTVCKFADLVLKRLF